MKEIFNRVNHYLLFVVLIVAVLYFGKTLLIPIVFGAMLAMLMAPLCRRLEKKAKFSRALATASCLFVLLLALASGGAIVVAQFAAFSKDVDKIEKRGKEFITKAQSFIEEKSGVTPEKQNAAIKEQTEKAGSNAGKTISKILGGITNAVGQIVLSLVFTFLFIYGKEKYESFFVRLYKDEDTAKVKKIVNDISEVSQRYLTGRVMSITIIAVLYSIGLSIVGIKNAILLAGIAALLTVIPYVGTVLGGLFPVMMALATEDTMQPALLAVLVMFVIQTCDNYFIEPNIVGGEVSLSALTSILSIIAGGLLWGVAGMILFLPMLGIVKIICDQIDTLKPIGYVIGDEAGNKQSKLKEWFQEKILRKKKSGRK